MAQTIVEIFKPVRICDKCVIGFDCAQGLFCIGLAAEIEALRVLSQDRCLVDGNVKKILELFPQDQIPKRVHPRNSISQEQKIKRNHPTKGIADQGHVKTV